MFLPPLQRSVASSVHLRHGDVELARKSHDDLRDLLGCRNDVEQVIPLEVKADALGEQSMPTYRVNRRAGSRAIPLMYLSALQPLRAVTSRLFASSVRLGLFDAYA